MPRPRKTPDRINPNHVKTRDPLMLKLINGATKSGAHRVEREEPELFTCRQCLHEYGGKSAGDGFCSDTCMKQYDQQLGGDDGTT